MTRSPNLTRTGKTPSPQLGLALTLIAALCLMPGGVRAELPVVELRCGDSVTQSLVLAGPVLNADGVAGCPGDGLTVSGDGVVLDGGGHALDAPEGSEAMGVIVSGAGVTVRGLVVRGFRIGIKSVADDLVIEDVLVRDSGYAGVYLVNAFDAQLRDSTLEANANGLVVLGYSPEEPLGMTVEGNLIKDTRTAPNSVAWGVYLYKASNSTVRDNTLINNYRGLQLERSQELSVTDNTIYGAQGVQTEFGILGQHVSHSIFSGNSVEWHSDGINCHSCDHNLFQGNALTRTADGLFLTSSDHNQIYDNVLDDNDIGDEYTTGLALAGSHHNLAVNNSACRNGRHGMRLIAGASFNTVRQLTAHDNQRHGVLIDEAANGNLLADIDVRGSQQHGVVVRAGATDNILEGVAVSDTAAGWQDLWLEDAQATALRDVVAGTYALTNATLSVEREAFGGVTFEAALEQAGLSFNNDIEIAPLRVAYGVAGQPGLDVAAAIRLEGVPALSAPAIKKDGADCPAIECGGLEIEGGVATFQVLGAGSYSVGEAGAPPTCETLADCADRDGDGMRDNACRWWACVDGQCQDTPVSHGDVGGYVGECAPDGVADGHDGYHVLNCFADIDTDGQQGYPCEDDVPTAFNVDVASAEDPCTPDGTCDGHDHFATLRAFEGSSTCSCAEGSQRVSSGDDLLSGPDAEPPRASLRARQVELDGGIVAVDLYLERASAAVAGYQLRLAATADGVAIQPGAVRVERRGDALYEAPRVAVNERLGAVLVIGAAAVAIDGPRYLGTFTYRLAPGSRLELRPSAVPGPSLELFDQDGGPLLVSGLDAPAAASAPPNTAVGCRGTPPASFASLVALLALAPRRRSRR